jgi:DNA (cytosine-5)-methyltransferase 1
MRAVISLFSGVGGLDYGFEAAGFRTAVAVEMDEFACSVVRQNRRWKLMQGDVHSFAARQILGTGGLRAGQADVLIAGPPCQPFSKASFWLHGEAKRLEDPRSSTLSAFLRVLRDTRPRAFLLENVPGFVLKGKDEGLQFLIHGLAEVNRQARTNYTLDVAQLNAADFGVPQLRERVFIVGSRDGARFKFPAATHGDPLAKGFRARGLQPYRTAWDAVGDLDRDYSDRELFVGGSWGELLPSIPEGQNYLWHTGRGGGLPIFGWRTRYWNFLLKLAKARPSWTIAAQPGSATGPFHWRSRRLTATEMCRIQTFPPGVTVRGGRADVQRGIGNAVPSLLAEVLGREIRSQLLDDKPPLQPLKLLPLRRADPPPPEPPAKVPLRYATNIGGHDDHPGEGLGRGALRRRALGQDVEVTRRRSKGRASTVAARARASLGGKRANGKAAAIAGAKPMR